METGVVSKIAELAQQAEEVRQITIDGRQYTDKQIVKVLEPEPAPLSVGTLTAFVDYLMGNPDGLAFQETIIQIDKPTVVRLISKLTGGFLQRKTYLLSSPDLPEFRFGQYYAVESFIILLQSGFVPSDTVTAILKIVGNISDGVVTAFDDDGITQKVTAKTGVTRVAEIPVPNPVKLAPYRTFPEIKQPTSSFVFRMRSGDPTPQCALFEADGGAWILKAMEDIKAWLTDRVSSSVTILG